MSGAVVVVIAPDTLLQEQQDWLPYRVSPMCRLGSMRFIGLHAESYRYPVLITEYGDAGDRKIACQLRWQLNAYLG